jgi:NhaP-type Na+/H+ or K+/H+ antiporter
LIGAWGFLAVFFAAVALRQTELRLGAAIPVFAPEVTVVGQALDPAAGNSDPFAEDGSDHPVSEGALVFKEHLERLSVVLMILLLGGSLFKDSWSWEGIGLALFVFCVARPFSTCCCYLWTRIPLRERGLAGWFGVRGIGSLYYLMYAIQHGLPEAIALQLMQLTLIVVTMSIVLHGISIKPLMRGKRRPTGMLDQAAGAANVAPSQNGSLR